MDQGVQDTCADCSMPLKEDNRCMCDATLCVHCCKCPDDCTCGCKDKSAKDAAEN